MSVCEAHGSVRVGRLRIYLDHNATTPLRLEAWEVMQLYSRERFGNPASAHWAGRQARRGLEEAREQVAALIGARPEEMLFTSGGTESNNLALAGVARALQVQGRHIVTTAVEHSSVLETLRALEREGFAVTFLPVDDEGRVDAGAVAGALRSDTILVSIALANNEVGTIQPIHEISCLTRSRGVLLHTDAVQAAGKLPMDVSALGVDLLSLSAHKIYGPKGVGALYVRRGVSLAPLQHGGPQERERRAGTENVAGLVGFGEAARLACQELEETMARCSYLTERLWQGLQRNVPGVKLNGPFTGRLANTLNVGFPGVMGESLMMGLDLEGIAVSTGSACAAGAVEPSHVILAMGRTDEEAKSAVRFSLGKDTTEAEIDTVLKILPGVVERICRVQSRRGERPEAGSKKQEARSGL